MVADRSGLCPRKSHGVRTNTVEKADAGTLDRCLGNWDFPCTGSGSCLKACYIPVYTNGKFTPADLLRYPRRDITYSALHSILMERSIHVNTTWMGVKLGYVSTYNCMFRGSKTIIYFQMHVYSDIEISSVDP